jgi:hypothetical protein
MAGRRLDPHQGLLPRDGYASSVRTFVFCCPTTKMNAQAWIEDEDPADIRSSRVAVSCLACRQTHFLDPSADRVLPPERP